MNKNVQTYHIIIIIYIVSLTVYASFGKGRFRKRNDNDITRLGDGGIVDFYRHDCCQIIILTYCDWNVKILNRRHNVIFYYDRYKIADCHIPYHPIQQRNSLTHYIQCTRNFEAAIVILPKHRRLHSCVITNG